MSVRERSIPYLPGDKVLKDFVLGDSYITTYVCRDGDVETRTITTSEQTDIVYSVLYKLKWYKIVVPSPDVENFSLQNYYYFWRRYIRYLEIAKRLHYS